VATASRNFAFANAPPAIGLAGYVFFIVTAGLVASVARALGEEIGWRGFLVPQLAKLYGFVAVSLISGLLWSAYHYPSMLLGGYGPAGPSIWYQVVCFTVMTTSLGFIVAWLRLRSGSVWPAALLHGLHNTIVQAIFTPLTTNTGHTDWYIDEFGAALAVTTMIGAIIVSRDMLRSPGRGR
jgi:membrane protease YdiL (CAAX protease family)